MCRPGKSSVVARFKAAQAVSARFAEGHFPRTIAAFVGVGRQTAPVTRVENLHGSDLDRSRAGGDGRDDT
jgi:hypothetical protein